MYIKYHDQCIYSNVHAPEAGKRQDDDHNSSQYSDGGRYANDHQTDSFNFLIKHSPSITVGFTDTSFKKKVLPANYR